VLDRCGGIDIWISNLCGQPAEHGPSSSDEDRKSEVAINPLATA
jgi:hypothetical protein